MTSAAEMTRELPAKQEEVSLEKKGPSPFAVLVQMGTDGLKACWSVVRWVGPLAGMVGLFSTVSPEALGLSEVAAAILGSLIALGNILVLTLAINSHVASKSERVFSESISPLGIIGKLFLLPLVWYDYTREKLTEK